ncbi:MAG: NADH-quinone oxidoreductase subunit J [Gammaproteobacteria bacterium]|nr:NADH-quinone oxidoreductase subunit J [Gammaproteobacteria bacterium]
MFELIIFYIFAGMLVLSALMVITIRNPVHAALSLVLSFFSSAAIWLLLEAEFLAIALVLVYVGAVMVLFLFVVMMLDINLAELREGFARYLPVGLVVAAAMVFAMASVVGPGFMQHVNENPVYYGPGFSNTELLGTELYTNYLYPFEIAGAVLLVAIIAAISLTMRDRRVTKSQDPSRQVTVKRSERVRLVKMKAEGNEE